MEARLIQDGKQVLPAITGELNFTERMRAQEIAEEDSANGPYDFGWVIAEREKQLRASLAESAALHETIATLREERDRLRKAYGDLGEEANSLRAELEQVRKRRELVTRDRNLAMDRAAVLKRERDDARERHQDLRKLVNRFRVGYRHRVCVEQSRCPNCIEADLIFEEKS